MIPRADRLIDRTLTKREKAAYSMFFDSGPKQCHPSVYDQVPDSNRTALSYLIRPYSLYQKSSEYTPSAPRTLSAPLRGSRLFRLLQEWFQDVGIAARKRKRVKRRQKFLHQEQLLGVLMFLTPVVVSSGSSQSQLSTRVGISSRSTRRH